ncbi:MAG: SGNH/GDSL hydrolase family protein [Verrucomicrobia bacterium]|nr:MAG: SGNH/GDSL hydrolase family protein [Verrucomicrobiota bacterium]
MRLRSNRLFITLAIGIALAAAVLGYKRFWFDRPVGHGPAGPIMDQNLFSRPWTERPVLLVGLGDSVTAGFGATRGHCYFDRLVKNPPDEFPDMTGKCLSVVMPGLQATNLSISGSTSLEHLEKELPRLTMMPSNVLGVIVITTGGNDLIHNYGRTPPREQAMYGASFEQAKAWIANFERRLETVLGEIETRFPGGCQIFLANIYDPTDGLGDTRRAGLPAWPDCLKILNAYNEIILQSAQKHSNVHVVDMHSAFLGHGIHCTQFWRKHYDASDPHYWFNENLEDPNERGYDVIRRLFLIEIARVLNRTTK